MKAVAIGLTCVIVPTIGYAQNSPVIQSTPAHAGDILNGAERARIAYRVGTCTARAFSQAGNALTLLPDSNQADIELTALAADSSCVSFDQRYRFGGRVYRGMVAEYYYKKNVVAHQRNRGGRLKLWQLADRAALAKLDRYELLGVMMVEVGECVDRADHGGVAALLDTGVATDAESKAFAALQPRIADCVQPGLQVKYLKLLWRGFMAEGALRNAASNGEVAS